MCPLLLARTPESQLTAEQSSIGRHWNSLKKIHPKTKEKLQLDGKRGVITIKSNPTTTGGQLTNWRTIIPQRFTH